MVNSDPAHIGSYHSGTAARLGSKIYSLCTNSILLGFFRFVLIDDRCQSRSFPLGFPLRKSIRLDWDIDDNSGWS